MKSVFKSSKRVVMVGLLVIGITALGWQIDNKKKPDTATPGKYATGDTTQPRQRNNDKDGFSMNELEEAMKSLDIEMNKLEQHIKELDINLSKQLNEAFAKIDYERMSRDLEDQLKKIDFDKIKIEINSSIDKAQQQLKQIDMKKLNQEMLELQRNFKSDKFKSQLEDAMNGAKVEMEKAKREMQDMKDFSDQLEKDGLIDKKKGFTIEWKKEGDLYINGKKQSKEISDKYSRYYRKDGYKIEMSGSESKHKEFL